MVIDGQELRNVLGSTETAIELRNEHGRCSRLISSGEALTLNLNLFVGIGNRRRIRFLRPRTQRFALNAGSRTTQRVKDRHGMNFTHPLIREHRVPRVVDP
jgi:hypothetical protein